MRKVFFVLLVSFLPMSVLAQRVDCAVLTKETVTKLNVHNIPLIQGLREYIPTTELVVSMNRARHCELPNPDALRNLDDAIAYRILKFIQTTDRYRKMFGEFYTSSGQSRYTSSLGVQWLSHNELVAKFNVWDALDVQHNWDALTAPAKTASEPSVSKKSVVWRTVKSDDGHTDLFYFSEDGFPLVQEAFKDGKSVYIAFFIPETITPESVSNNQGLLQGILNNTRMHLNDEPDANTPQRVYRANDKMPWGGTSGESPMNGFLKCTVSLLPTQLRAAHKPPMPGR
jgi:hypothetical protein